MCRHAPGLRGEMLDGLEELSSVRWRPGLDDYKVFIEACRWQFDQCGYFRDRTGTSLTTRHPSVTGAGHCV